MSTYIISDIHGCYDQYKELLSKINFGPEDELYVLGDVVDRGPEPIKVLLDLMERDNVTMILGNHEAMAMAVLGELVKEVSDENIENLPQDIMADLNLWLRNGGEVTMEKFQKLSHGQRADVLSFLEDASYYETIEHDDKLYVLVHGGLAGFDVSKELDEYEPVDLLWERPDYDMEYFPGGRVFLVTGHTPTAYIRYDHKPFVFQENGHIAIDCGCAFGGNLAAYCIETGEATYVEGKKRG